jgi:hypothetical protein
MKSMNNKKTPMILAGSVLAIVSVSIAQQAAADNDLIEMGKRLLEPKTANAPGPNDITYSPSGQPNQQDLERLKKQAEELQQRKEAEQRARQNQKH